MKLRIIEWVGHAACKTELTNAHSWEGTRQPLRHWNRQEDNIKINLRQTQYKARNGFMWLGARSSDRLLKKKVINIQN